MFNPKSLYFYFLRVMNEPFFIKNSYKVNIIKLESLHLHSDFVLKKNMQNFKCKFKKNNDSVYFCWKIMVGR